MMKNQPLLKIFTLLLAIALLSCRQPVTDAPPTPLVNQQTTTMLPTPTAVSTTSTEPTTSQPTPTLAQPTAIPTLPPALDSIGDPYAPELGNSGYDVQLYDITLAIDPAQQTIDGGVTITAVSTEPLTQLSLDFVGYEISETAVNNTPTTHTRVEDKLFIELPTPTNEGETFTVTIAYRGTPTVEPSRFVLFAPALGLRFVDDESAYILSEPDGTRYWLPNNDHLRDKAAFRYTLAVPEPLTAVANGTLLDTINNPTEQTNTYIWEHQGPMSPYLATIAVGNYVRIDDQSPNGVPLRHYIFTDTESEFARASSITGEAIDWMSDLFGPYPFENFGFVTADAPGASLETQTMVVLSTNMIGQTTVIHEIAHMWFGNWVGLDSWSEMWRNEGFATYITIMWDNRNDPEGLELEMAAVRAAVEENGEPFSLGNPPPASLFSFHTYFGGALMVHELRETMGDEAFFAGLKLYFERYGDSTASDAEFQAVMEEAYGQSLDTFFAVWLE